VAFPLVEEPEDTGHLRGGEAHVPLVVEPQDPEQPVRLPRRQRGENARRASVPAPDLRGDVDLLRGGDLRLPLPVELVPLDLELASAPGTGAYEWEISAEEISRASRSWTAS